MIEFEILASFAILSFIYGGIHTSSWNGHFPSYVERLIWKIAVCVVAGGGFIELSIPILLSLVVSLIPNAEKHPNWVGLASFIPMLLFLILCVTAKIFLVVESFISVRSLPVGAYNTTNWINFLPHI